MGIIQHSYVLNSNKEKICRKVYAEDAVQAYTKMVRHFKFKELMIVIKDTQDKKLKSLSVG